MTDLEDGKLAEAIPDALRGRDQWVCWQTERRDGKLTKVPIDPATGGFASTADRETWTDLSTAQAAVGLFEADGVGFVFTDDDPLVGVDLDDCRDRETGETATWASEIVDELESYTEVSPSGTGVHVIVEGSLPDGRNRAGDVELYETGRYFTVTGEHVRGTPSTVKAREDALRAVYEEHIQPDEETPDVVGESADGAGDGLELPDEELLERAMAADNGDAIRRLWNGSTAGYDSHSEADMALCCHLAFWTACDPGRMDRLFRRSGLLRDKWDEVHYSDGSTYGERTIERAIEQTDDVYEPPSEERSGEPDGCARGGADVNQPAISSGPRDLRTRVSATETTIEHLERELADVKEDLEALRADVARESDARSDGEADESGRSLLGVLGL